MRRVAVVTVAALTVFAACGNDPAAETAEPTTSTTLPIIASTTKGGSPETTVPLQTTSAPPAVTPRADLEANDAVDGPVMRHPKHSDSNEGLTAEVRGVLELDGSCLYVARDDIGGRYPIVWPAGTRWDQEKQAVVSPMGESMAIGDEVYGGGGYFYVADVEQIAGPQASSLAADCADNTYGEIAVVNNWETAIGPAQP